MSLPIKSMTQLVSDMVATWSAQTGRTVVFSAGDILLSWWQSVAVQLDFLQAQVQLAVALSRAQSSSGADLDTWMAQFGFVRLGSTLATGQVVMGKNVVAGLAILIPDGSIVQTVGGDVQYEVVADTSDMNYSLSQGGWILQAGQTSISVEVQAITAGSAANVTANTLTQFGSNVAGIDTVTNPAAITNGIDSESDDNLRSRFVIYLSTLAKATKAALIAAATGVQQGITVNPLENQLANGQPLMGSFTFITDDGSGSPPLSTLNAVYNALDVTRAFSVQPFVSAPTAITATVAISVRLATGLVAAVTNNAVQAAISNRINQLDPGETLYISDLITAALSVSGVIAVQPGITINGASADLIPSVVQEIRATVNSVLVGNY